MLDAQYCFDELFEHSSIQTSFCRTISENICLHPYQDIPYQVLECHDPKKIGAEILHFCPTIFLRKPFSLYFAQHDKMRKQDSRFQ